MNHGSVIGKLKRKSYGNFFHLAPTDNQPYHRTYDLVLYIYHHRNVSYPVRIFRNLIHRFDLYNQHDHRNANLLEYIVLRRTENPTDKLKRNVKIVIGLSGVLSQQKK